MRLIIEFTVLSEVGSLLVSRPITWRIIWGSCGQTIGVPGLFRFGRWWRRFQLWTLHTSGVFPPRLTVRTFLVTVGRCFTSEWSTWIVLRFTSIDDVWVVIEPVPRSGRRLRIWTFSVYRGPSRSSCSSQITFSCHGTDNRTDTMGHIVFFVPPGECVTWTGGWPFLRSGSGRGGRMWGRGRKG